MSLFSTIVLFLSFQKYLRSVFFPRDVISAFLGFVFYLCQDLSCVMTGSSFRYFVVIPVLVFLKLVEKFFQFLFSKGV